jgi:hypothetical protein
LLPDQIVPGHTPKSHRYPIALAMTNGDTPSPNLF